MLFILTALVTSSVPCTEIKTLFQDECCDATDTHSMNLRTTAGPFFPGALYDIVKQGTLTCQTKSNLPMFALLGADGNYTGLEIDLCKAHAVALGVGVKIISDKTWMFPLPVDGSWAHPAVGPMYPTDADIAIRQITKTDGRDTVSFYGPFGLPPVDFGPVYFYDEGGITVRGDMLPNANTITDLNGQTICVGDTVTYRTSLPALATANGVNVILKVVGSFEEVEEHFINGTCAGYAGDRIGALMDQVKTFNASHPEMQPYIVPDIFLDQQPIATVTREGSGEALRQVSFMVFDALIQAARDGITQSTASSWSATSTKLAAYGASSYLIDERKKATVAAVGNWMEILERHSQKVSKNKLVANGGVF